VARAADHATTPVLPMPVWISSTPHSCSASCTRPRCRPPRSPVRDAHAGRAAGVSSGWNCAMCANGAAVARAAGAAVQHQWPPPADAQARIDGEIQQVDHQVDHDEDQRDQAQVGRPSPGCRRRSRPG
jgi:hypothetical protein